MKFDLQQIGVARAEQVLMSDEDFAAWAKPGRIAEQKMDGARYKLHTFSDINRLDSRRLSVKDGRYVEKTDNVPHLRDMRLPSGWVVDTEIIARHGETSHQQCANTTSIMGSKPERAIEVQQEHGTALCYAFDVLIADGVNVRHKSLSERLELLEEFLRHADQEHIRRMPAWTDPADFQRAYDQITKVEKGEGLVVKDLSKPYGHPYAWAKAKYHFDIDVVTTGSYMPGKGKYKGMVGAVEFGLFKNGTLVPVGMCSGMTDAVRDDLGRYAAASTLGGRVFECRGFEVTRDGMIRNPSFKRWRLDKNAAECTFEAQLQPHIRG